MKRFDDQLITGIEVLVKAANSETDLLHKIGDTHAGQTLFPKSLRRGPDDAFMVFGFLCL
jgi:hypothetical protein